MMEKNFGPELRLLLLCARTTHSPDVKEKIQAMARSEIDWDFLIKLARKHRVLPLLYQSLNQICPNSVPNEVLSQLGNFYQKNTLKNLSFLRELINLLKLFKEHNIKSIPLKGPLLAKEVYGNLSYRQMVDLDILIPFEALKKAGGLMRSKGYQGNFNFPAFEEKIHLERAKEQTFSHPNGIKVELHWQLYRYKYIGKAKQHDLWNENEVITLSGMTMPFFTKEKLMIYLCNHGALHMWDHLMWLCDISELVKKHDNWDWEAVWEEATSSGSQRALALGLLLSSIMFGTSVPEIIKVKAEKDKVLRRLIHHVYKCFLNDSLTPLKSFTSTYIPISIQEKFYAFWLKDSYSYKMEILYLYIRPQSPEFSIVRLPKILYPLYYLIRPFRIFAKLRRTRNKKGKNQDQVDRLKTEDD